MKSSIAISLIVLALIFKTGEGGKENKNIAPEPGKAVWAINAGGPQHVDALGIHYATDPLTEGIASSYGMERFLNIGRVRAEDAILYQTERYSLSTFGYDIPIKEDGKYVLVLKFSEVYFTRPNQKVFDVTLNHVHKVVEDLDIFLEAGIGNAHHELIPLVVSYGGKKLSVRGVKSDIVGGTIRVNFIKGILDNPKINAIVLWKGSVEDIPELPQIPHDNYITDENYGNEELEMDDDVLYGAGQMDSDEGFDMDMDSDIPIRRSANRRAGGRGHFYTDPYDDEDAWSTFGIPVGIAVVVCIVAAYAFKVLTKSA